MVIADLDVVGITIDKAKADTPLIIHRDGILPLSVVPESVKTIAWRYPEIIETRRTVDVLQLAYSSPCNVSGKSLRSPSSEQTASTSICEGLDYSR